MSRHSDKTGSINRELSPTATSTYGISGSPVSGRQRYQSPSVALESVRVFPSINNSGPHSVASDRYNTLASRSSSFKESKYNSLTFFSEHNNKANSSAASTSSLTPSQKDFYERNFPPQQPTIAETQETDNKPVAIIARVKAPSLPNGMNFLAETRTGNILPKQHVYQVQFDLSVVRADAVPGYRQMLCMDKFIRRQSCHF